MATNKKVETPAEIADLIPDDRRRHDPRTYVDARMRLLNEVGRGTRKSTDFQRIAAILAVECEANTGIEYGEAAQKGQDKVASFISLMQSSEAELLDIEKSFADIDDKRLTDELKKKYSDLIRRTIKVQKQAREDPAKLTVYVFRNEESNHAGEVLMMEKFHLDFFEAWNDPSIPHSLVEAPIGHGKSVCLRGQMVWEIGNTPELRCLYITDVVDKANKTLNVMKSIIKSRRYRSVFPKVRVLSRSDRTEDSKFRFTVSRANTTSREPTIEGVAIQSQIQGNRYDRIFGDDVCNDAVENQRNVREETNRRWEAVIEGRVANAQARIRYIGTPWHDDDVAGRIAKAHAAGKLANWRVEIDRFRIKEDAAGNPIPIWPSKWSVPYLADKKARMPRAYLYNYQLNCASESHVVISRVNYFNDNRSGRFTTSNDKALWDALESGERWLSIDPAGTTGKNSSDTGIVEIILTAGGYPFVTNCWFLHVTITDVIDWVCSRIRETDAPRYHGIHWESAGSVKVGMGAINELMARNLREGDAAKNIAPYQGADNLVIVKTDARVGGNSQHQSKEQRLKQAAGYIQNGFVRFAGTRRAKTFVADISGNATYVTSSGNSNVDKLVEYVLHFDSGRGSDAVDALTQWILYNRNRIANPSAYNPAIVTEKAICDPWRNMLSDYHKNQLESMKVGGSSSREEDDFIQSAFGQNRFQRSCA